MYENQTGNSWIFAISFELFGTQYDLTLAFWFTFVVLFAFAILNIIGKYFTL